MAINLSALHPDKALFWFHKEHLGEAAVRSEDEGPDVGSVGPLHHNRSCTVTKEDAASGIGVVRDPRKCFRARDEHYICRTALYQSNSLCKAIEETGACCS